MNRSTRLSAVRALYIVAFATSVGSGTASAMPFGAFADDHAWLYLNAGPLIQDAFNQSWYSGAEAPVTSLTLVPQNIDPGPQSGNGIFYDPYAPPGNQMTDVSAGMEGYANASGSISDGALHAMVDGNAADVSVCPTSAYGYAFFCTYSSAYAHTYENWQDTLFVNGPANAPITLQITDQLLGQITNGIGGNFPTDAYDYLAVCGAGTCDYQTSHIATSGVIDQDTYGLLTVYAGETLTLENQLILETQVGISTGSVTGSVNFADTANSFIDVLTPGGSIVSASGVDYATPTVNAAPTPGTLVLVLAGVLALGVAERRTRSSKSVCDQL